MSAMPAARVTELGSLDATGRLGREGQREQDGAVAGPQLRESQPGEPHGGHQLELEVGLPGAVVDRLDGAARGSPRVVDDAVDAAPAGHGRLDEGLEVSGPGDVGPLRQHVAARRPHRRLGGAQPLLVAAAHADGRTLGRQLRRRAPVPARRCPR